VNAVGINGIIAIVAEAGAKFIVQTLKQFKTELATCWGAWEFGDDDCRVEVEKSAHKRKQALEQTLLGGKHQCQVV